MKRCMLGRKFSKAGFLAAVMALVLAVSACGGAPAAPPPAGGVTATPATPVAPAAGADAAAPAADGEIGTVVWVSMSEPPTLDSNAPGGNNSATADLLYSVLEKLVRWAPVDGAVLEGQLATSWERGADASEWIFNLRQGVYFTDGTPFNAHAVQRSLMRVIDPDTNSPVAFILEMMESVDIIDDYTVQINLHFPFAPFPNHLAHPAGNILSPALLDRAEASGDPPVYITENMVGTGPFMIDHWEPGDYRRLVPNPNHWGVVPQVNVEFRVIPAAETRSAMLNAGEAHITNLAPAHYVVARGWGHVNFIAVDTSQITWISMNTQRGYLQDVRVRQAIAKATDREAIFYGPFEGLGTLPISPLTHFIAYNPPDAQALPFDPERARELMHEAGFGPDNRLALTIGSNEGNMPRAQTAELLQSDLRDIYIDLEIQIMEWGAYLEATGAGLLDMHILGWGVITADADYGLYSTFHTSGWGDPGNRFFYSNPRVDALLDEGRMAESARRTEIYAEAIDIIVNDAPGVWLIHPTQMFGLNGVEGITISFNSNPRFYNARLTN